MAYSLFMSSSALTNMADSVQNQPQPAGPALPSPSPSRWPGATLPPALLARAATETPPLRLNEPAAAVTGQRMEKRGPRLPPSGKGATKKPRTAQAHTPPASFSSVVVTAAAVTTERRLALDKKVAGCLLARIWTGAATAWRQEGRAALRCLCLELPRGPRCALHQDTPGWSWMEKGGVPPVGGDGKVLVPMAGAGDDAEVFPMYARWRKNVRMPSRFYMQHVRAIEAGRTGLN